VDKKPLSPSLAASQAKLVETGASAALDAMAACEAEQHCAALTAALAAAELGAEASVSGRSRLAS